MTGDDLKFVEVYRDVCGCLVMCELSTTSWVYGDADGCLIMCGTICVCLVIVSVLHITPGWGHI